MPYESASDYDAWRSWISERDVCGPFDDEPKPPMTEADTPAMMTAEQACRYLRLEIGRSMPLALKALDRLTYEQQVIRPCMYRKQRLYSKVELDRFIQLRTESYRDVG